MTQFFEKYTSHFIWKGSKGLLKVLLCERWVGGWTELQHIDPHSYGPNSVSFPFSWAAQPGAWGPSFSGTCSSFQHLLSNWSDLLSSPGLYNFLMPTFFLWVLQIALIQPVHGQGYILIFLYQMHLLFTHFDSLTGVNMLQYSFHYCYYYYHFTSREFFTPALAGGLSLKSASSLRSPWLFSVFWPISTMLYYGLSYFVLQFSNSSSFWGLFQACQL